MDEVHFLGRLLQYLDGFGHFPQKFEVIGGRVDGRHPHAALEAQLFEEGCWRITGHTVTLYGWMDRTMERILRNDFPFSYQRRSRRTSGNLIRDTKANRTAFVSRLIKLKKF